MNNRRNFISGGVALAALTGTCGFGLAAANNFNGIPASGHDADWIPINSAKDDVYQLASNLGRVLTPHIRVMCHTAQGVKDAVAWAQATQTPFAVRSGGHCFEGFSQSAGMVIDMRRMNTINVDPVKALLTVGPGARLGEIVSALAPYNLVLPAGHCQTVGIGGHIGGGGIGVLARPFGLACDHLVQARLIAASSKELQVSAKTHAELFWALRGGGSGSFGVVTEMSFKLRKVPKLTLVEMQWRLTARQAAGLINKWQRWCLALDRKISCFMFVENDAVGKVLLRSVMVSIAPRTDAVTAAQQLFVFATTLQPPKLVVGEIQEIADAVWPRDYYPKRNHKVASEFLPGAVPEPVWRDLFERLISNRTLNQRFSIEAMGGVINDLDASATAFPHRDGSAFVMQFDTGIAPGSDLAQRVKAMRMIQAALQGHVTGGAFVNYPDLDLTGWAERYWGENVDRLRQVKQRYDPQNLFSHAQSVPL